MEWMFCTLLIGWSVALVQYVSDATEIGTCPDWDAGTGVDGVSSFVVFSDEHRYTPGSPLRVTVAGTSHVEGFHLQAYRSPAGRVPLGSWLAGGNGETAVIRCEAASDTAVHVDRRSKHKVAAEWTPRLDYGPVYFRAQIQENHTSIWRRLASEIVHPHSRPSDQFTFGVETSHDEHHHVMKRDAEGGMTSDDAMTEAVSTMATGTTRGSDKAQSLFVLFTIIGAYIGMYTIFSLLLI